MGVGILAKRVVLELGSSTNFVYSLRAGGFLKIPRPQLKMPCPFLHAKASAADKFSKQ